MTWGKSRVEYEETPEDFGRVARIRVVAPNGVRSLVLDVSQPHSLIVRLDDNAFVLGEDELREVLQHLAAAMRV